MSAVPFAGLRPATSTQAVRWAVEAMVGREGVALVVPAGFEACARLLHPLDGGRRWRDVAPAYFATGDVRYAYPFPEDLGPHEGDMGTVLMDGLVPVLRSATTTPRECHFGLWQGWGELHPGSHSVLIRGGSGEESIAADRVLDASVYEFVEACATQPWWGGRDMLLFDGPIEAVASIGWPWPFDGTLRRRGPQWWWPDDRAWFVATEIDYPWTYLAGSADLVERVIAEASVEAIGLAWTALW